MPRLFKTRKTRTLDRMFETRSEAWAAVGLEVEINRHEVRQAARRLPLELLALIAIIVGKHWALRHLGDLHVATTTSSKALCRSWRSFSCWRLDG